MRCGSATATTKEPAEAQRRGDHEHRSLPPLPTRRSAKKKSQPHPQVQSRLFSFVQRKKKERTPSPDHVCGGGMIAPSVWPQGDCPKSIWFVVIVIRSGGCDIPFLWVRGKRRGKPCRAIPDTGPFAKKTQ